MTRADALAKLKETRSLSTDLLEPLGIPFEIWLRFCQAPQDVCDKVIDRILERG